MSKIEEMLFDGPKTSDRVIVLAHGAGAPMDSPFMAAFAEGLANVGLRVVRFEFPYMQRRRREGGKRPPDRAPVLETTWREVIDAVRQTSGETAKIAIGGKSMGGRIASMIADETGVDGLVCLGYPFHPPGKPEKTRTEHLAALTTPTLIVQGTRDSLGTFEDVASYVLSPTIRLAWMEDGDHSFKPRKASGRTEAQNWDEGIAAVAAFMREL